VQIIDAFFRRVVSNAFQPYIGVSSPN